MSSPLTFPSQAEIMQYLDTHPLIRGTSLKEEGLIEPIAKAFANQEKFPLGIKTSVSISLLECNVSEEKIMYIYLPLSQALQDCAEGKKIHLEKR